MIGAGIVNGAVVLLVALAVALLTLDAIVHKGGPRA